MKEEEREDEILVFVEKFEAMLQERSSLFFDIDEFELIGEFYLDNGSFEKAITLCDYALTIYPDNMDIVLLKGHALLGIGKISEAKELLVRYKHSFVRNVDVYLLLATIHNRMKEHQKAIDYYLMVLKDVDEVLKIEVSFDLVQEYQLVNDFPKAIELLSEMLIKYSDNESVQFELAYCLDHEQENEKAIKLFSTFVDNHPYSYTGWFNLGNFLLKVNKLNEALDAFELSCAIKVDYVPSIINCGMIRMIQEEYLSAINYFSEVINLEDDNDFVYCALAEAYEMNGEYSKAISSYEKAIEVNALNVESFFGLAYLYNAHEEYKKALSYITKAWELDSLNEAVVLLFFRIKMELGENIEAEDLLTDYLAVKPDSLSVALELADFYYFNLDDIVLAFDVLDDGVYGEIDKKHILVIRKATYLHSAGQRQSAYNELHYLLSFFNEKSKVVEEVMMICPDMMLDEEVLRILA